MRRTARCGAAALLHHISNDGGWDKLSVKKAINPKINVRLVEIQDYDKRRIKVFNPRDEQAIKSRIETLKRQINIIDKR